MTLATEGDRKVRILCVDDDPSILEGLSLHLGRRYQMLTASSGFEGLSVLHKEPSIAVVISDMRMPAMDGATFLSKARKLNPNAVRLLLTGQTDIDSAVAAINEGQIFRFLTKPTPPTVLVPTVEAALAQHRLITAERDLLEQTLLGSMKTLTDILSLTSPLAFGRSMRIRDLACALARQLGVEPNWQLEIAAMLSQLGCVSLPDATLTKIHRGERLDDADQLKLLQATQLTDQLLSNIPRLEVVRGMLSAALSSATATTQGETPEQKRIQHSGKLIRLALEFDALELEGKAPSVAIDTIRGRSNRYDPAMLAALQAVRGEDAQRQEVRELSVGELRPGMVFMEDVKLRNGVLLVARGYEVTPSFLVRVRNYESNLQLPLRVLLRPLGASASGSPLPAA